MLKEVIQIHDVDIKSISEKWAATIEKQILWNLSNLKKPLKYIGTILFSLFNLKYRIIFFF